MPNSKHVSLSLTDHNEFWRLAWISFKASNSWFVWMIRPCECMVIVRCLLGRTNKISTARDTKWIYCEWNRNSGHGNSIIKSLFKLRTRDSHTGSIDSVTCHIMQTHTITGVATCYYYFFSLAVYTMGAPSKQLESVRDPMRSERGKCVRIHYNNVLLIFIFVE